MKLRTGHPRYKIPAFSRIETVLVAGNQKHNQMCAMRLYQIPLGEMSSANELRGFPIRFSVFQSADGKLNIMEFYPVPDKPYKVLVRYLPPLQEF